MIKDKLKNLLSVEGIFIILLFILFCYLFIENFVFSESYEMTQFRYCDDEAFNQSLYHWQIALKELDIQKVFCFNDFNAFGYGWIFWALHGIITFPFFLFGMEQLTISTLRNISLIMSFASLYLIYKILGYYTKNKIYKMLVIIAIVVGDYFILYSIAFDTTAMIRFFGILSIYFIIKDKNISIKTIVLSSLFLGISVATKIIGIVFVPIVGLLLLDRLRGNELKIKFKKIGLFAIIFIFSTIFFTTPGIFLFLVDKDKLLYAILPSGEWGKRLIFQYLPNYGLYFDELTGFFYGYSIAIFLLILYLIKIVRDIKIKQYDFIYYLIGIIILPIFFLFVDTGKSGLFPIKYYAVIMILLPFSLIELEKFKKAGYFLTIPLIIVLIYRLLVIQHDLFIIYEPSRPYNLYYKKEKILKQNNFLSTYNDLKELIKPNKDGRISFWLSHPFVIKPCLLNIRPFCISQVNDNILEKGYHLPPNYDYYIFDKNPPYCCIGGKEEVYNTQVENIMEQMDNNSLDFGSTYTKIYDKYDMVVYKKDNL